MARLDDMHVNVVYTYAPETLMSAGDFDALMKAKQEIDAAWAVLAEIDQGCFAAAYQHLAPAIKALDEMLKEWRAGYAIEARRADEYRAARNELAEQLKACQAELQAATAYTPPYAALISELGDMKRQLAQAETALANEHEKVASLRDDKAYFVEATKKARAELEAERQKCKQLQGEKIYLARAADDAEQRNKIAYQERAKLQGEIASLTRERDALLEANDYNIRCAGNLNTHVIALEVEKQRLEKECAANLVAVMSAGKSVAEYSDKCAKLELRSGKLNARIRRMRGALLKIEETYESVAKLHSMAYQALVDEEELAQEQERVCGAS